MPILFAYDWTYESQENIIRIFGIDEHKNTIVLHVTNFNPYLYVEVPENLTKQEIMQICDKLQGRYNGIPPEQVQLVKRKHLYYASDKKYPYLLLHFNTNGHFRQLASSLGKNIHLFDLNTYLENCLEVYQLMVYIYHNLHI